MGFQALKLFSLLVQQRKILFCQQDTQKQRENVVLLSVG